MKMVVFRWGPISEVALSRGEAPPGGPPSPGVLGAGVVFSPEQTDPATCVVLKLIQTSGVVLQMDIR
jgi:hypothetical protein